MSDTVSGSYNNSFMIADKKEAFILEAAGKRWAARKVEKGYAAISNELSIRKDLTYHNTDLIDHAIEKGWWSNEKRDSFDFAEAYINHNNARQLSHIRVQRIRHMLKQAVNKNGEVSVEYMKRILRDHYEDTFLDGPYFNASAPDFLTICMHNSPAGFTWGNTASSSITILPDAEDRLAVMWWAAVVPCCSVYIPVFVESGGLPECLKQAGTYGKIMCAPSDVDREDTYKEGSFWWEVRALLDNINGDENGSAYQQRHEIVRSLFDELEIKWLLEINAVESKAIHLKKEGKRKEMEDMLYHFTEKCTKEAMKAIQRAKEMFSVLEK